MKIHSIFKSIDGEVNYFGQGTVATFIRFAGCNLVPCCPYCDTDYALFLKDGIEMDLDEVMRGVKRLKCPKITITGGEPLMQPQELSLLTRRLAAEDYLVTIETNGSLPLVGWNIAGWVVDYKLSNSGHKERMIKNVFLNLRPVDIVKFVVGNFHDFDEAVVIMQDLKTHGSRARFAFSPMHERLSPEVLYQWIDETQQNDVLLNVQLHKYIGVD